MLVEQILKVIELLEVVKVAPYTFIGIRAENIIPFIDGVLATCRTFGLVYDTSLYESVVRKHGWEYGSMKPWDEMRERGLSDEAMIREFVTMEIERLQLVVEQLRLSE